MFTLINKSYNATLTNIQASLTKLYSGGKNQVKIENLMDRNTSRLLLVLFKRYYRGASMKPCRRVPLWCSFCNIGVKGHSWKMSKITIFLENSLLLQLKNAGIM